MRTSLALCLAAALATLAPAPAALAGSGARAGGKSQPAHHPKPKSQPDFAAARAHYRKAEKAAAAGHWKQAGAEYMAAYEITKDPVLFFKIGTAHDRGGDCRAAVGDYRRYLREGKPNATFAKLTQARIRSCQKRLGAAAKAPGSAAATAAKTGPTGGGPEQTSSKSQAGAAGSRTPAAGNVSAGAAAGAKPASAEAAGTNAASGTSAGNVTGRETPAAGSATRAPGKGTAGKSGAGVGAAGAGAAIDTEEPPHSAPAPSFSRNQPTWKRSAAWTSTGLAIAFAATGAVLALSASARQNDINSLINFRDPTSGMAPTFDGQVRTRYEDLVNQGNNLELASRLTLAAAGVAAGAAVTFFLLDASEPSSHEGAAPMAIAPMATGSGFGLAAGWEF